MKAKLVTVGIIFGIFSAVMLNADDTNTEVKQAIKANGQLVYNKTHKQVDSLSAMFQEGAFYGRLRNNNFYFAYDAENSSHDTHVIGSVGASVVYKSAELSGFDFTLGLYGSRAFFDDNNDPINRIKAGKDALSRYEYVNTGNKSMGVIGQASLDYRVSKTDFVLGRQLVETFYTKSNDTKMIPNTFDGLVVGSKDISDTTAKFAYLYQQKLRDHLEAHSVLMVGDANSTSSNKPEWSENDDAGMHKGLTYTALVSAGKPTDAPLIILDLVNKSINNLKINFSSYVVPELISQTMGELNYTLKFDGFSIAPGVRYIQQFDNGAGSIGGASLKGDAAVGYKDKDSLDAKMIAARVVTKIDNYKINLGYTNILDEADLVTPWRGFPTAGYTRSMGIYNWRANTQSYRIEVVRNANKTGIYKNMFIQASALYIDTDEDKKILEDSMFYYTGFVKNFEDAPELQLRLRLGYRDFIGDTSIISDYLDSRFEANYLF